MSPHFSGSHSSNPWGWVLIGCLLPVFAASGEDLGRLFFTPAERAHLDHQRRLGKQPDEIRQGGVPGTKTVTHAGPEIPDLVRVGGYVKRSDGGATVWVNGLPVPVNTISREIEIGELHDNSNQIPLRMRNGGQMFSLKAGQSYDLVHGRIVNGGWEWPMDSTVSIQY